MATTYYLSGTNSDLTGGADFSKKLLTATETAGSITVSVAKATTEDSFGFTEANVPSTDGVTGNYTVEINITTANGSNVKLAAAVARVNSAGTQQAISAFTAEQDATSGVHTFSFTSIDLGVWATGDRLKVVYRFRNIHTMSAQSVVIGTGTVSEEVVAPWSASLTQTRGLVSFTEFETPSVATRGLVSFAEFEAPLVGTRGLASWAELEVPSLATATRGLVSFAEFETPLVGTRGVVSWVEFEAPTYGTAEFYCALSGLSGRSGGGDLTWEV